MAAQAQSRLIPAMKTKISTFDGSRECLKVTEWNPEFKETLELIIASEDTTTENYIIRYDSHLFNKEALH